MPPNPTLLSLTELAYLHSSLSLHPPIRPDARSATTFRPLRAETDLLPSTNGSARLCFADGGEAIVGVKCEVEKTVARWGGQRRKEDVPMGGGGDLEEGDGNGEGRGKGNGEGKGEDGWVEVSIEMPGAQREDEGGGVFLAEMIREGLVAGGGLQGRLWINAGWHWRVYIDILLLSPPQTYPLPLLSLTTHLALLSTRLPSLLSTAEEDPLFNDDWDASHPLYSPPTTTTTTPTTISTASTLKPPITLLTATVGETILFDPSHEELAVADTVLALTIATSTPTPSTTTPRSQQKETHHRHQQQQQKQYLPLLAIRTIDPPSRLTIPASTTQTSVTEPRDADADPGIWTPKRGGVSRTLLRRMVEMCTRPGGVGEEVLRGLEGFVGVGEGVV